MAERFVLQIFADTKQASAELKRFAAEQEALANRLKSQAAQPAGAGSSFKPATPTIAAQARSLGAEARRVQAQQDIGLIDPQTASRQQSAIAIQRKRLLAEAQATLGVSAGEAEGFLASQERQGRLDVVRALRTQREAIDAQVAAIIADAEATRAATVAAEQEAVARREAAVRKEVEAARTRKGVLAERDTLLAADPEFLAASAAAEEARLAKDRAAKDATLGTRHQRALEAKVRSEEQRAFVDNQLTSTAIVS